MGVNPPLRYRSEIACGELETIWVASTFGPSSSRRTSNPRAAKVAAVTAPPAPEPTTATWVRIGVRGSSGGQLGSTMGGIVAKWKTGNREPRMENRPTSLSSVYRFKIHDSRFAVLHFP